jgi:hydroxyacid-oxoacid transhydrogenase
MVRVSSCMRSRVGCIDVRCAVDDVCTADDVIAAGHLPHGMSVILCAPAAAAALAAQHPERHAAVASALGCMTGSSSSSHSTFHSQLAQRLKSKLVQLMRNTGMPSGLAATGYSCSDAASLAQATMAQQRLLNNMPSTFEQQRIQRVFEEAMVYW